MMSEHVEALVIGAGPAGLMAAQEMAQAGFGVVVVDAMASPARKFLMAGKSGLNLTKNEPLEDFLGAFTPLPTALRDALEQFGPNEVMAWAEGLGQPCFTGSTGRVFPVAMKGSPLLRAWLSRLDDHGVELRRKWCLISCDDGWTFSTPEGDRRLTANVVILALGGASWARLGSNGAWSGALSAHAELAPFAPANAALNVAWTSHMSKHFGHAVKGVALSAGPFTSRGEFIISHKGLEGGGIYTISRGVREGFELVIDLLPDMTLDQIEATLKSRKSKETIANALRKALRLGPEKIALLMEFARPLPAEIAPVLKHLSLGKLSLRQMDEAISTAGGIRFASLTDTLELKECPNVFAAGEMLDWEAPTGGYLLTACLATGRLAGRAAIAAERASKGE